MVRDVLAQGGRDIILVCLAVPEWPCTVLVREKTRTNGMSVSCDQDKWFDQTVPFKHEQSLYVHSEPNQTQTQIPEFQNSKGTIF